MPTARRLIDPNTSDYTLTLGSYEPDVGVTSKVYSRVATRKGSIVPLPGFGSLLHTIKGPFVGFEKLGERYVHACLADLVSRREVNRLSVTVARGTSQPGTALLDLTIVFYDRRGRRQKVRYTHRVKGA